MRTWSTISLVMTAGAALAYGGASSAQAPAELPPVEAGIHYHVVESAPATAAPTVTEIFSYACPHCFSFESFVAEWLPGKPEAIRFVRTPASGMRRDWDLYARAFYTAESLNLLERIHTPLFERVHLEGQPLSREADVVAFFEAFGADAQVVRDTLNGFYVETRMRAAMELARNLQLTGVPSVVVNGRYVVDIAAAGSEAMLEKILNELPLAE